MELKKSTTTSEMLPETFDTSRKSFADLENENKRLKHSLDLYRRQKETLELIGIPLISGNNRYVAVDNIILALMIGAFAVSVTLGISMIKDGIEGGNPALYHFQGETPLLDAVLLTAAALGPTSVAIVVKIIQSIPDMSSIEGMYGNRQRMMMKLNHKIDTFWMNLGYHSGEYKEGLHRVTYPEAASNMARKLAQNAGLTASDKLVDIGFGYGDQDFLFHREFGVKDITGFNLCMTNVEIATQRAKKDGLEKIIDFRYGDAVKIPLTEKVADKVFSLESAFHYETREDFFREAFRILKPGGILATADYIPKPGVEVPEWAIPPCIPAYNVYDINRYTALLTQIGFTDISIEDITKDVWMWPNPKWEKIAKHKYGVFDGWFDVQYPLQPLEDALGIKESLVSSDIGVGFRLLFVYLYYSNYYIITAKKPENL